MTPERHQRIERLRQQAMERPASERASFLEAACAGDEALRREVESLLPAGQEPGSFRETLSTEVAAPVVRPEETQPAPRRKLAHYEVRALLGSGGMGQVFLAEDPRLARSVAIKLLAPHLLRDDAAKARFLREARAASKLDHPNIGTIHDIGEQDGELFMVMALYEGETLKQRLERGAVPVNEALGVLRQVAQGLEAAHRAGIVHRDIKPANVLMTKSGTAKILDFGLAKLVSDSQGQTMTGAGLVMGTPLYMSPEQLKGDPVDTRSDLWSFGALAYELLSGVSPFQTDSTPATISRVLHDEPASLASVPGMPGWVAELVSQLLQKDPARRPQSASEVLDRLERQPQRDASPSRSGAQERLSPPKRRSLALVAAAVVALAALGISLYAGGIVSGSERQVKSLAVLPFVNESENPNADYLSDGIAESLIDNLSQITGLQVIARTTAFRYKGRNVDFAKLRRELSVDAVLTGRVQQQADTLVVQADLINVGTGAQLWGEKYNQKLTDLLAVERGIAKAISDKLRPQLDAAVQQRVTRLHTENPDARQLYLKGRYEWNKRTPEGFKKSIEYFNQAIEKDPGYALAYAGLADCYSVAGYSFAASPEELYPPARAAAAKAVQLDDALAEAHVALAAVRSLDWDWPGAEREFKRATELNPGYATAHFFYGSMLLLPMGRFEEAIGELKKAKALDPFSATINTNFGRALFCAGRYDEAVAQYEKVIAVDPGFARVHVRLAEVYEQQEKFEEAIAEWEKVPPLTPDYLEPEQLAVVRQAYAVEGAPGYWRKRLEFLKSRAKRVYVPPTLIAAAGARLGDKDQAFAWLDKAYEGRDLLLPLLKVEPAFRSLSSDPRYASLLRRIGLPP